MIFEHFVGIMFGFWEFVLGLLPVYDSAIGADPGVWGDLVGAWQSMNRWMNTGAMIGVLSLWAGIEVTLLLVRSISWVYARIPLKST